MRAATVRPPIELYPNEPAEGADAEGDVAGEVFHECEGEAGEEMAAPRRLPNPIQPRQEEREEHELAGHAVFRDWCRHCMRGRCKEWAHRSGGGSTGSDDNADIPVLHFDYCYLCQRGNSQSEKDAAERAGSSPVLVMWDARSKGLFGFLLPA